MKGVVVRQNAATRNVARALWLGGVELNLPEVTWLVGGASVSDHYPFQCLEAMFFSYLYAVGSGELIFRIVELKEL